MRKSTYIFIAIITFLVGISGYCICLFLIPVKIGEVKNFIPLYELERNPQSYLLHKISMREHLVVLKNNDISFDYYFQGSKKWCRSFTVHGMKYSGCTFNGSLNFVGMVKKDEVEMIEQIAERNAQRCSMRGQSVFGAEVEIEGYINQPDPADDYFLIDVTNIKQISPIEFIPEESESED